MNAANEVAVEAFLNRQIKFPDIAVVNQRVVEQMAAQSITSVSDVLAVDEAARKLALEAVKHP